MRKKILVISHERSGTHFLINTIARYFDYLPQQIDLDNSQNIDWRNPEMARHWLQQFQGHFVANIFKSHHSLPLLTPLLPDLQEEFHVFYIQRDGRDVMTSFWTYLNRLAPGWGPRTATVGEFMRAPAIGGITQYQHKLQGVPMLQRWIDHVTEWQAAGPPVHYIRYEDLHMNFNTVVEELTDILQQPAKPATRPTLNDPSSLPWKGRVGSWQEYFSDEDVDYYNDHVVHVK